MGNVQADVAVGVWMIVCGSRCVDEMLEGAGSKWLSVKGVGEAVRGKREGG
jgi:hypothetical protein